MAIVKEFETQGFAVIYFHDRISSIVFTGSLFLLILICGIFLLSSASAKLSSETFDFRRVIIYSVFGLSLVFASFLCAYLSLRKHKLSITDKGLLVDGRISAKWGDLSGFFIDYPYLVFVVSPPVTQVFKPTYAFNLGNNCPEIRTILKDYLAEINDKQSH